MADDDSTFLPITGGGAGTAVNSTDSEGIDLSSEKFKNSVIGIVAVWVIKNVFITPAGWVFALLDWVVQSLVASIGGLEAPLATAGASIREGLIGPFETLRGQLVVAIGQAGLGAPIAAALVNALLAVVLVAAVYLLMRVFAAPAGGFA